VLLDYSVVKEQGTKPTVLIGPSLFQKPNQGRSYTTIIKEAC